MNCIWRLSLFFILDETLKYHWKGLSSMTKMVNITPKTIVLLVVIMWESNHFENFYAAVWCFCSYTMMKSEEQRHAMKDLINNTYGNCFLKLGFPNLLDFFWFFCVNLFFLTIPDFIRIICHFSCFLSLLPPSVRNWDFLNG